MTKAGSANFSFGGVIRSEGERRGAGHRTVLAQGNHPVKRKIHSCKGNIKFPPNPEKGTGDRGLP